MTNPIHEAVALLGGPRAVSRLLGYRSDKTVRQWLLDKAEPAWRPVPRDRRAQLAAELRRVMVEAAELAKQLSHTP